MIGKRTSSGSAGDEMDLLRAIRARAGRAGRDGPVRDGAVRLGIGDDCALLGVRRGEELAVTTDLSIAGRHFRVDWHPPEAVGHRTLARGLSDLASMGARPVAAFLSLGLPRELTVRKGRGGSWVDRFFAGLFRLADEHHCPLAGGDLAESPLALADIALVGAVPAGKALRRSGARPGDLLYVTGTLGGAAAGLAMLAGASAKGRAERQWTSPARVPAALRPHLYPQPRIRQGLALRQRALAVAAIDLSDGLSIDLTHMCEESDACAVIQEGALPIADGATLEHALHGGEDYELLFAGRPSVPMPRSIGGVPITAIGYVTRFQRGKPRVMIDNGSSLEPLGPHGWQHFRS